MITQARHFDEHPRLAWAPALAIGLTMLALCTLGDSLRDALDPHLVGERQGRAGYRPTMVTFYTLCR